MMISRYMLTVKPENSVKATSYNRHYSVNLEVRQSYSLVLFISVWWEITFTLKYSIIFYFLLRYPHSNCMTGRYIVPLTYKTFTTSTDTKLTAGLYISLALIVAIL
jgi:hypothetical protein